MKFISELLCITFTTFSCALSTWLERHFVRKITIEYDTDKTGHFTAIELGHAVTRSGPDNELTAVTVSGSFFLARSVSI